jgi:hypothetical protein
MLKHLFPLFEHISSVQVSTWTALWVCVHPITEEKADQLLATVAQRANTGGQGEIGTPALWDVPIFLKPTPNDS